MAPPVAYERQAYLGIYTTHEKNIARRLCSSVSKFGKLRLNRIKRNLLFAIVCSPLISGDNIEKMLYKGKRFNE